MTHEELIKALKEQAIDLPDNCSRYMDFALRKSDIEMLIAALEKLEDLKWLMENYPIRIDHYDTEHGNKDFVLGVESMREYVLDVLNGEISVDIEALKADGKLGG